MNQPAIHETAAASRRPAGSSPAFTLTELLVVMGMTALLASVLLSASFTTQERALRAQCVSNLRQIGMGINLYAADANGYVPICCWPTGQNPWQTYEACRVSTADGTTLGRGFYNLGLLFRTKVTPDPRIFYCPIRTRTTSIGTYDYYATAPSGWPSTPAGSNDDNVRTGYNYYPQLRATERVITSFGVYNLPKLTYTRVQLEFGAINTLIPVRLTDLDPKKCISTETLMSLGAVPHQASGSLAGLNALFPDGRVVFQNARGDPKNIGTPWDPIFWSIDVGSNPNTFRIIMNGWQP